MSIFPNILSIFNPNPIQEALINPIQDLIKTKLWARILLGMVLGLIAGLILSPSGYGLVSGAQAYEIAEWLRLPGNIFLRLIQMVVMPLIVCSVILGVTSCKDIDSLRRLGLPALIYFIFSTVIAIVIGITVSYTIKPGKYIDSSLIKTLLTKTEVAIEPLEQLSPEAFSLPEKLANLIPVNPLKAGIESSMLEIVIFSLIIGVVFVSIGLTKAKPLYDICEAGQIAAMKVVSWAMKLAPYAVFGLLCDVTIRVGLDAIVGLSMYIVTVIAGLMILLIVYLILVMIFSGRPPWSFLSAIREVQLLAFSTSSSAAVIPLSLKTAEEKLNVNRSNSQFIIPVAATINMDGTALYQMVAVIFLTQIFNIELSLTSLLLLTLTALGASIGAPSSPGIGIIILSSILQSIGVPIAGLALIIGVDRILDMLRTAINVSSDLTACIVIDKIINT